MVNPDTSEISDIELLYKPRYVKLVNSDIGEISDIELSAELRYVKLVSPDTAEISDIELLCKSRYVRLVNPDTGEISDIELLCKSRYVRLVNSDTGEISDIELLYKSRCVRLVADSSPVKSLMDASSALSTAKGIIFPRKMGSSGSLPRAPTIAARRLELGMSISVNASRRALTNIDISHSSTLASVPEARVPPSGENDTEVT